MLAPFYRLFFAVTLTLLTETIIYAFLRPRDLKFALFVIALNGVLNLVMNVALTLYTLIYGVRDYLVILLYVEVGVFILEALFIYGREKTPLLKTFLVAFLANFVSLSLGLLNNTFTIIDTSRAYSLFFSFGFIVLLCLFLYYFTTFPPLNEVDRQRNRHGDH